MNAENMTNLSASISQDDTDAAPGMVFTPGAVTADH